MWFDPNHRMKICKSCESLTKMFTCKECHCFMPAKILLPYADCPLKKWTIKEIKE